MARKKQVRIRIKPLRGIGGVGDAGDTAWMDKKEAEQYEKDGYLEILPDKDEPVVSSVADQDDTGEETGEVDANDEAREGDTDDETGEDDASEEAGEDHQVKRE